MMDSNIPNVIVIGIPTSKIYSNAIHIDTVKLSHQYKFTDLPPPDELYKRGFDIQNKIRGGKKIMNAKSYSLKSDPNEPRSRITISEFGYCGIYVEASLAKLIDGIGLRPNTQEDINCALDAIEDYIRQKIGVDFNARTAIVNRFDANADFQVGEDRINAYIKAIPQPYAKLTRSTYGSTTLYYFNKSRTFAIYGKKEEMKARLREKKVTWADVEKADGLLRVEARLTTTEANKRFAKQLNLPVIAGELLTMNTANYFVADTLNKLGLDKPKIANVDKEMSFKQAFGFHAPEMLGTLIYRKYLGEKFWEILHWSPSKYYNVKRKLKEANLWDISPTPQKLPALRISPY